MVERGLMEPPDLTSCKAVPENRSRLIHQQQHPLSPHIVSTTMKQSPLSHNQQAQQEILLPFQHQNQNLQPLQKFHMASNIISSSNTNTNTSSSSRNSNSSNSNRSGNFGGTNSSAPVTFVVFKTELPDD